MRTTKSFSFDVRDMGWIRRMERDARRQSPAASNSKHLIHIVKYYFNHQRILREIGRESGMQPSPQKEAEWKTEM